MDWADWGLPGLLVRPLTNLQSKEGLRIPYCQIRFCEHIGACKETVCQISKVFDSGRALWSHYKTSFEWTPTHTELRLICFLSSY